MSYSISVRGATIAAALAACRAAYDEQVVKPQPVHAKDRDAALAAAEAQANLLGECPVGMEVTIALSGSLGWRGTAGSTGADSDDFAITSANTSASAYFSSIPAAAPTTNG